MQISINRINIDVPDNATLSDAITRFEQVHGAFTRPVAAAVNLNFVPASQYASHLLAAADAVEIIRPVTGG